MLHLLLWLSFALTASWARPANYDDDKMILRWVDAAVNFVRNLTCEDAFLTSEEECVRLISIPRSQMNVYVAGPTPEGRLHAVLPDGTLNRVGAHDAVLTLDPYPMANFGHLLVVFFVDIGWGELQCEVNGGQYLGEKQCLTLALKKRCHNLLQEAEWKTRYLNKRCEINFLPLVHLAGESPNQLNQRLTCRDDLGGFAACPELRSKAEIESLVCDPLISNTKRCSTTHETVGARCRLFERCDHAILLSGGWNQITGRPFFRENIQSMFSMLRINGFPQDNIKIFYANGGADIYGENGENHHLYASAFKLAMRYYLQKLCLSAHCADSLVLYLNSPTRNDGSSLLWDVDSNGQVDENEMYTIRELLYDIQDCAAQQIYIIADQSYSGKIITALEHSARHKNVIAFASGQQHEYSWNSTLTKHWTTSNHYHTCVEQVHKMSHGVVSSSQPVMYDGSKGEIKTTLAGAPCDVKPPFSKYELQNNYFGCQNLPSSVWVQRLDRPGDHVTYDNDEQL